MKISEWSQNILQEMHTNIYYQYILLPIFIIHYKDLLRIEHQQKGNEGPYLRAHDCHTGSVN